MSARALRLRALPRRALTLAGFALALSLAGTAAVTAAPPPTRIAASTSIGDAPTLLAQDFGLFDRHGMAVTFYRDGSGAASLARLRAGDADFALMPLTPLVLDALADPTPAGADDPVILASLLHSSELTRLVTLADSGIERPGDLAGRTLGIHRGSATEFVWAQLHAYHGIDPAAVERIDRPLAELIDALARREIDAAILWEPWVAQLVQRLERQGRPAHREIDLEEVYTAKWVLVTTRRIATRRPALCRAMLIAHHDAIDRIHRDPGAAARRYAALAAVDPDLHRLQWDYFDYGLSLDWSLIADLRQQLLWGRTSGHPVANADVAVLDLIADAPLRAVYPRLVGIPHAPNARYRQP